MNSNNGALLFASIFGYKSPVPKILCVVNFSKRFVFEKSVKSSEIIEKFVSNSFSDMIFD